MAISIVHQFVSAKPDGVDSSLVQPSNWNAPHTIQMATARLIGRTTAGTGAAEEITVGSGLLFASGVLSSDRAAPGANSDITSLSGLTTPLSIVQGGTGANSQSGARTALGLGSLATKSSVAAADLAALGAAKRLLGSNEASTAGAELTLGGGLDVIAGALTNTYTTLRGQSVNMAPSDTNGIPTFMPSTAVALSITTTNVSSTLPLVATANQGLSRRVGQTTANLTFGSLAASSTNFLFVTVNADGTLTAGSTALAPIYQRGGIASVTSGQYTYIINERKMYLGNGSTADLVWVVFVGEAVTSGSAVTSAIAYALNGRYRSAQTTIPTTFTIATFLHNIGVLPEFHEIYLVNTVSQYGYNPGEITRGLSDSTGNNQTLMGMLSGRNTMEVVYHTFLVVSLRASGAIGAITRTSWQYVAVADRGWD
jgi:hypothetical protein